MSKNRIWKSVKKGIIVLVIIIAICVMLHITMNCLVPFIASMHNNGGVY